MKLDDENSNAYALKTNLENQPPFSFSHRNTHTKTYSTHKKTLQRYIKGFYISCGYRSSLVLHSALMILIAYQSIVYYCVQFLIFCGWLCCALLYRQWYLSLLIFILTFVCECGEKISLIYSMLRIGERSIVYCRQTVTYLIKKG